MGLSLDVVNLKSATYECIYGRGCDGICCQNGRPPVPPEQAERIESVLARAMPLLSPAARKMIEAKGYLSNRKKSGDRMLRVADGWCVFFNQGCVLHKLGAEDGDSFQYKPSMCSLFPLDQTEKGKWYVRQWGYEGEEWDLFCLNPAATTKRATETLTGEVELLEKVGPGLAVAEKAVARV